MTTKDIEIKDQEDNRLVVCAHQLDRDGFVSILTAGPSAAGGFRLAEDGAQALVDWLTDTFELTRELEALGVPLLRITVPPAMGEGAPREVTWSGEDEPPAWFERLALIALTGVTPDQVRRASGGISPQFRDRLRGLLDVLGAWTVSEGTAKAQALVQHVESLSAELNVRPAPESLAILRKLMAALGCERVDQLPERVEALRRECDRITQALATWARVGIGMDGVDQLKLIEKIKSAYRADRRRLIDEQLDVQRRLADKIDGVRAQEQQARAAVNVELEQTQEIVQNQAARIEKLVEELRLAKIGAVDLRQQRTILQEQLDKSREYNTALREKDNVSAIMLQKIATERDALKGKLTAAREVLADMAGEFGHEDGGPDRHPSGKLAYDNRVIATWFQRCTEALEKSDPNQA